MTQLLPPADLYASMNRATLTALGAGSVKVVDPGTVEVSFDDLFNHANASAVLSDAVNGAKVVFTTTDTREIAAVVDARSAAGFLKQHPGVTEVVKYEGLDERPLIVPGTVDGATAHALNGVLKAPGAQDANPFILAGARPADATPTEPIPGEFPKPTPIG